MNDASAPGNNTRLIAPSSNNQGQAPGNNTKAVAYTGATTYNDDAETAGATYASSQGGESALLVTGGLVALDAPTVTKTGDASGDDADFYGVNAAMLATSGATLNISGGNISTDGAHANAVFAYGSGTTINIAEATITTKGNNSGGIMVTGGGTLTAENLTVDTSGNSSAAIRSDRGGGTMSVTGGTYTTHGVGSPAIYSTASVSVSDAELISTSSEGIVIEGMNSVVLNGVSLTDTNNTLNGQSETYKNVFIYQSMSGDASEGTGSFVAEKSTFITNKGDHFFITNTSASIDLKANSFTQNDASGAFLRAATGKWGTSGKNGGHVILTATDQEISGDIVIDSISTFSAKLSHSYVRSAFLGEGEKSLTVSSDSVIILTADSYLTNLENASANNSNIYANGHKLFVAGTEVSINQGAAPENFLDTAETTTTTTTTETVDTTSDTGSGFPLWGWFAIGGGILVLAFIGALIAYLIMRKRKQSGPTFGNGHNNVV